jgi:hypothetical protein
MKPLPFLMERRRAYKIRNKRQSTPLPPTYGKESSEHLKWYSVNLREKNVGTPQPQVKGLVKHPRIEEEEKA